MFKSKFIIVVFILFFSQQVFAVTEKEAAEFFKNCIKLGENFDVSIKKYYSDDAKIHTYRRYPHGLERASAMTGKQWKELVDKIMSIAKKRGDISKYKNIPYTIDGSTVKVKADRYSVLKCYTDKGYYMVIRMGKGGFQIIEEYSETQPQSDCIKSADDNLEQLLNNAKKQIKGHLPLMVDEETRLEAVQVLGDTFYYIYTLINVSPGEFDSNSLSQILRPMVLKQSCNMPNLRSLINAGATIAYTYNDKDGKEIATIKINKDDCQ